MKSLAAAEAEYTNRLWEIWNENNEGGDDGDSDTCGDGDIDTGDDSAGTAANSAEATTGRLPEAKP